MRTRWFGPPWPEADARAPVCDDDEFMVETPVGEVCVGCRDAIVEGERGLVMSAGEGDFAMAGFGLELTDGDGAWWTVPVCAYHVDCLLRELFGPELAESITPERRPE